MECVRFPKVRANYSNITYGDKGPRSTQEYHTFRCSYKVRSGGAWQQLYTSTRDTHQERYERMAGGICVKIFKITKLQTATSSSSLPV